MSDYAFVHEGKVFTPNRTQLEPSAAEDHNRQLELRELATWAEKPDRTLGYYQFPSHAGGGLYRSQFAVPLGGATVTTWPGTVLGRITEARVYRHNFGQRFVSLRVLGTNGAEYWGRASWDGGNCVVLRKVRGAK